MSLRKQSFERRVVTNLTTDIVSKYIHARDSKCVRKDVFSLPFEFKMFTWKASLAAHYESMMADFVYYYENFVDFESIFYVNRISPPLCYTVDEDLEGFGDRADVENPLKELAKFFVIIQELNWRHNFRVNLVCSNQSKVSHYEKIDFDDYSQGYLGHLSIVASSVMGQLLPWFEDILREPPYSEKTLRDRRGELMHNALEISHKAIEKTVIKALSLDQIKKFADIDGTYALIDSHRKKV